MKKIMKANCIKCGKKFKLDFDTIWVGSETQAPWEECVVIKCPHCDYRKEI